MSVPPSHQHSPEEHPPAPTHHFPMRPTEPDVQSSPDPLLPGGDPSLFADFNQLRSPVSSPPAQRPSSLTDTDEDHELGLGIASEEEDDFEDDDEDEDEEAEEEEEEEEQAGIRYRYNPHTEEWTIEGQDELDNDDDDFGGDVPEPGAPSDFYPKILHPVPAGVELERSGSYARPPDHYAAAGKRLKDYSGNMFDVLSAAEASGRPFDRRKLGTNNLPNTNGTEVASYGSWIYSGQYSDDGTFFYTCAQAYRVHIYDMTTPPVGKSKTSQDTAPLTSAGGYSYPNPASHSSSLKLVRTFQAPAHNCRWTITDATLSPDNNWIAYSSITPYVHLIKTRGQDAVLGLGLEDHEQDVLDLSGTNGEGRGMGIWSLRFGAQGKELVAGCGRGRIVVYDVERRTCLLNVRGHGDDTNAVCFADKADPHILVSGSDDSYLKVWDRRCLKDAKPAGALVGHTQGITFVSSKDDGRFIVSNGKDQCAKLWDLRKMIAGPTFDSMKKVQTFIRDWDYRNGEYARPKYLVHPQDCSLVTYRGHHVLNTLIRVHFSPPHTTGQRFIASGSADGNIHIWNLDGTIAQVIQRGKAAPLLTSQPVAGARMQTFNDPHMAPNVPACEGMHQSAAASRRGYHVRDSMPTVRDISWNPNEPTLMSTAWGGSGGAKGSLAMHPFMPIGRRPS